MVFLIQSDKCRNELIYFVDNVQSKTLSPGDIKFKKSTEQMLKKPNQSERK